MTQIATYYSYVVFIEESLSNLLAALSKALTKSLEAYEISFLSEGPKISPEDKSLENGCGSEISANSAQTLPRNQSHAISFSKKQKKYNEKSRDSLLQYKTLPSPSTLKERRQLMKEKVFSRQSNRKNKKIKRALLRFPWKNNANPRKQIIREKVRPWKKIGLYFWQTTFQWGASSKFIKQKREDLMMRKKSDWNQAPSLLKISREMAYLFS